jgi:PEGA domain
VPSGGLILLAMSKIANPRLARICTILFVGFYPVTMPVRAQNGSGNVDQREVLGQILTQAYQPSQVGKGLMGIGSATAIRRAGTIVVVQRPGLYGSFDRNEIASSEIHGLDSTVYRGNKDYPIPPGERFYVFSISVVQDNVTIALLSARLVNGPKGSGRIWTALTFYFPAQTLANADKDDVLRGIVPWLAPEGLATISAQSYSAAAPASPPLATQTGIATQAPPAALPQAAPERPAGPRAQLAPGMTRDEIVAALGAPQREMSFEGRVWLTYPTMVVALEDGKLKSIDQSAPAPAKAAVHSTPDRAEIYLDGQLIGSTPSTVELPAGTHELSVRLSGYQDWTRSMRVLSGSEINLDARLEKK